MTTPPNRAALGQPARRWRPAGQRLVSLALSLRLARFKLHPSADPGQRSRIDQAEDELRIALGELREVAHGIFPAVLADEGLAAAVEALAEDATVPIRITALPEGRLEPAVETAAYVVVAEVIMHSSGNMVTVGATRRDGQLMVEIAATATPPKTSSISRTASVPWTDSSRSSTNPGDASESGRRSHASRDRRRRDAPQRGLDRLLTEAGFDVVGKAATPDELHRRVELDRPDVAIVDIKMPPTHTDEGLVAAQEIRGSHPTVGVLVLSHYLASRYAMRLLEQHPGGVGYLLKDRVSDVAVLTDALWRIHEGECVLDPTIVARLIKRPRPDGPLVELTERERQVLALMAEGRSNQGICDRLILSLKTVEAHVKHIFAKLGLEESPDDHRRVLAVLTYLRASTG